jgi:hypothetical protein
MALGSTQPLTEMNNSWPVQGLTNLPDSCPDCLGILGTSTSWIPRGLSSPLIPTILKLDLYYLKVNTGNFMNKLPLLAT